MHRVVSKYQNISFFLYRITVASNERSRINWKIWRENEDIVEDVIDEIDDFISDFPR